MSDNLVDIAKACFYAGLAAADPEVAVQNALVTRPLDPAKRLITIAFGKAAVPMINAAQSVRPADRAIMVTNTENFIEINGVTCLPASHPTPDTNGLKAAQHILDVLQTCGENDQVLVLVSGGGSALLPAPIAPITLAEKALVNDLMLGAGLAIEQINTVRRRLSMIKGGGMARAAQPAEMRSLILSDVVSDDLSAIASGPTIYAPDTPNSAQKILEKVDLWNRAPASVRASCEGAFYNEPFTPDVTLVGSNKSSTLAMTTAVPTGYEIVTGDAPLTGDVDEIAKNIANQMRAALPKTKTVFLWGGEPTVVLTGKGKGGRNQELSLRVAQHMGESLHGQNWCFLSAGTDGIDGPTDAAGGFSTKNTVSDAKQHNIDLILELSKNNSYPILRQLGGLFQTGATGTNVADLMIGVVG